MPSTQFDDAEDHDLPQFGRDAVIRVRFGLRYDPNVEKQWPDRIVQLRGAISRLERVRSDTPDAFERACVTFHESTMGKIARFVATGLIGFTHKYGRWDAVADYERPFISQYFLLFPHLKPKPPRQKPKELAPHFYSIAAKCEHFKRLLKNLRQCDQQVRKLCTAEGIDYSRLFRKLGEDPVRTFVGNVIESPQVYEVLCEIREVTPSASSQKIGQRDFEMAVMKFRLGWEVLQWHLIQCGLIPPSVDDPAETYEGPAAGNDLPDVLVGQVRAAFEEIEALLEVDRRGRYIEKNYFEWFCDRMALVTGTTSRTVAQRISEDRKGTL